MSQFGYIPHENFIIRTVGEYGEFCPCVGHGQCLLFLSIILDNRSKHRKRVPFSVNLPVRAIACRTDFACWEESQTLLRTLPLPTTPHRAVLTEFWEKFFKKFSLFLNTGELEKCQCIKRKFLKIFLIGVDCCILINTCP